MFDATISLYTKRGWQIISHTPEGVQFRKPKQWSKTLLITGLITAVFGVGLLVLLLAAIDYAIKKEKTVYIGVEQVRNSVIPPPPSDWSRPVVIGLLIIAVITACLLLSYLG